ncbi:SDR family NAD(P)-dependent oxidoreductase [archaeon]|nr:SDR family NAD(P)-dependent oxidoreductase [archaeon]
MSIIVTGCNRGIGEGIASVLINNGYQVTGLNRTRSALADIDEFVQSYDEINCDVSDPEQVKKAIAKVGNVEAVVANAGIRRFGNIEDLSLKDWQDSINTNLNGVFYLAREVLPIFKQFGGYFIVIGSHAEKYPFGQGSAYCASKLGGRAIVDCMIDEARWDNVRATYLSIGSVKNREHGGDESWKLKPEDLGKVVVNLLKLPKNVLIPYMDVRPAKPLRDDKDSIEKLQFV